MTAQALLDAQLQLMRAEQALEEARDHRAVVFAEAREEGVTSGDIGRLCGVPPHVAHHAIRQGLALRRVGR